VVHRRQGLGHLFGFHTNSKQEIATNPQC